MFAFHHSPNALFEKGYQLIQPECEETCERISYNKVIKWRLVSQGMDTEDEVPVQIRLFRNEMMCGHSFSFAGNA